MNFKVHLTVKQNTDDFKLAFVARAQRSQVNVEQGADLEELMQAYSNRFERRDEIGPRKTLTALEFLCELLVTTSIDEDL